MYVYICMFMVHDDITDYGCASAYEGRFDIISELWAPLGIQHFATWKQRSMLKSKLKNIYKTKICFTIEVIIYRFQIKNNTYIFLYFMPLGELW